VTAIDLDLCRKLVGDAAAGDAAAGRSLVEHLWPTWIEIARASRNMGGLARSDDHVHNVVARMVEKIGRADGRGLKLYSAWQERNPEANFEDWIRIVMANVIRDYVRAQLGPRPGDLEPPSPKRLMNEFVTLLDEPGVRPPVTAAQTARELLEFARSRLPPDQLHALSLWLESADFADIERALDLPAGEGRRVVRAAVAVIRRHFAPSV